METMVLNGVSREIESLTLTEVRALRWAHWLFDRDIRDVVTRDLFGSADELASLREWLRRYASIHRQFTGRSWVVTLDIKPEPS